MKLIYFYEKGPGPCVLQNIIIDNIEKESGDSLEIQRVTKEDKELAEKYKIKEIPSIIIENDTGEVARFSGLTQELFLKRAIEKNSV